MGRVSKVVSTVDIVVVGTRIGILEQEIGVQMYFQRKEGRAEHKCQSANSQNILKMASRSVCGSRSRRMSKTKATHTIA